MKLDFRIEGGLLESLDLMEARAEDLAPPMKEWGGWKRKDVKEQIQGEQGFMPLAESTMEKRRRTRTGRVTRHGHLRAGYARRLDARSRRMQARIAGAKTRFLGNWREMPPALQRDVLRWQKELTGINRALRRTQDQTFAERKSGKTLAETKGTKIFPKLPGTIRMKVEAGDGRASCAVGSAAGIIGKVHNEGGPVGNGARVPARTYLVITRRDVEMLKRRLFLYGLLPLREDR